MSPRRLIWNLCSKGQSSKFREQLKAYCERRRVEVQARLDTRLYCALSPRADPSITRFRAGAAQLLEALELVQGSLIFRPVDMAFDGNEIVEADYEYFASI